jgi:hypothetical protein
MRIRAFSFNAGAIARDPQFRPLPLKAVLAPGFRGFPVGRQDISRENIYPRSRPHDVKQLEDTRL